MKKSSAQVFLNLPFDKKFEPILVAYVSGLVSLGLAPRSVLELSEDGRGRMERMYRLMKSCDASIHDLSYAGKECRYNMPFELGVCFSLAKEFPAKEIYIFEGVKYEVKKTLSDLGHFDAKCHSRNGSKALQCIYDCFTSPIHRDSEAIGAKIYTQVMKNLPKFRNGRDSLFHRSCFGFLVSVTAGWARTA